tara:strand:- start:798 stop:1082 length:285 start_codon:yes stop_codon:yes gene_type:complete
MKFISICVNNLFQDSDFKNKINHKFINKHNNENNAWITINKNIYSLKNDDTYLLSLFRENYGKDVRKYLLENHSNKEIIIILDKLKNRKIGEIE